MKNLLTIIFCLGILICTGLSHAGINKEITLIYSNDVRGETEPCG